MMYLDFIFCQPFSTFYKKFPVNKIIKYNLYWILNNANSQQTNTSTVHTQHFY